MPILVVDDEPVFRSAAKTILRKAGFHTIEARDGLEAYEIVRAMGGSIELLPTDFQMPRMDGLSSQSQDPNQSLHNPSHGATIKQP